MRNYIGRTLKSSLQLSLGSFSNLFPLRAHPDDVGKRSLWAYLLAVAVLILLTEIGAVLLLPPHTHPQGHIVVHLALTVIYVALILYPVVPLVMVGKFFTDYESRRLVSLPSDFSSPFSEIQAVINTIRGVEYKNLELDALRHLQVREQNMFFANASHELRTPLTSLMGWADLLEEEALGPLTPEQRDGLKAMQASIQRLTVMVNNTIDISKIEVGRMQVEEVEFNAHDEMGFIEAQFAPQIAKKKQTMFVRLADGLPNIYGDPDKFKQVMTNLVSNAVKYTPEGGTITVSVERCPSDDSCVLFRIEDNGVGIPKSSMEEGKLFSKFYQVRVKDARIGSGLGLAIVKELLNLMHGSITVESEVDNGTTFVVMMPGKKNEPLDENQEPVYHQVV